MDNRDLAQPGINDFFLADRAELINNRLYVMGGFTTITFTHRFPALHLMSIVLLLRVPSVLAGQPVDWTVRATDPLLRPSGNASGKIVVTRPPQIDDSIPLDGIAVVPVFPVNLTMPGRWRFTATAGPDTRHVDLQVTRSAQ